MLLTQESLADYAARIAALRPETQRKWGSLDAHRLLNHLRIMMEMSLNERTFPDMSNVLTRTLLPVLAFYVLPWPKGKLKAPDALTPPPEYDFETERSLLLRKMEQFVDAATREPQRTGRSPLFGDCTLRFWQRMHGKHFDHHLRQFGV